MLLESHFTALNFLNATFYSAVKVKPRFFTNISACNNQRERKRDSELYYIRSKSLYNCLILQSILANSHASNTDYHSNNNDVSDDDDDERGRERGVNNKKAAHTCIKITDNGNNIKYRSVTQSINNNNKGTRQITQ